jgi:hypothetical protein
MPLSISNELPNIDRQTLAEAARSIAGKSAPDWLVNGIIHGAGWTAMAYRGAERLPARGEQQEKLEAVRHAAQRLISEFSDPWTGIQISHAGETLFFVDELIPSLEELGRRAEIAATALRDKKGPDRAWPLLRGKPTSQALKGPIVCAITVTEAWLAFHGSDPKAGASQAQQSCALVWAAIGAHPLGKAETVSSWRPHIQAALEVSPNGGPTNLGRIRRDVRFKFRSRGGA